MNTQAQSRKRWFYGLAALVVTILALGAFLNRAEGQSETVEGDAAVTTAFAFTDDLETSISANGNLGPSQEATLAFRVNGQIESVFVEVGDTVSEGDALVTLDAASLERAVNDAEQLIIIRQAEVDALRTDAIVEAEGLVDDAADALEDAQALADGEERDAAIADAELALDSAESDLAALQTDQYLRSITIAEAQLQQAENALLSAESNLAGATLYAPFDGTISRVNVQPGDLASGAILTLFNPDSLVVTLEVDEIDLRELAHGADATLTVDALPSVQLDGTVDAIAVAPTLNQGDRVTYAVTVAVDDTDEALRYGMSTKVRLTTAERNDVLLIPNEAITATDDGTYYVSVMEGDTMVRVEVEIGVRDRDFTEVESGLSSGDEVVVRLNSVPTQNDVPGPGDGGGPFGN